MNIFKRLFKRKKTKQFTEDSMNRTYVTKPAENHIIAIQRVVKTGELNANGVYISEEVFKNALKNYINLKGGPVYLAPKEDDKYIKFEASDKYLLGNIVDTDKYKSQDNFNSLLIQVRDFAYIPERFKFLVDNIIQNKKFRDCSKLYCRYDILHREDNEVTAMKITSMDIPILTNQLQTEIDIDAWSFINDKRTRKKRR